MKKRLYNIVLTLITVICVTLFVAVFVASAAHRSVQTCTSLKVEFSDPFNFVTEEDIKSCIDKQYGAYIGQRIDSVNLYRLESLLDSCSAVLKSEAYLTADGTLNISISQRKPVVRFQDGDTGFYADERGFLFPLQKKYTSDVPVVDGYLPLKCTSGYKGEPADEKQKLWVRGVLDLLKYISTSKVWNNSIVQMHVTQNGDLILVPRTGQEKFIIGYPDEIPAKFSRIEKYYQYIRAEKGEDYYTTVNVKFDGQVICRK